MKNFLKIYAAFFKQQIKALMEYRVDFMMGMIALAVQQVSTFLIIFAVFTQIKSIGGYSFNEILLFYGYSQLIRGIDHVYNDNIWQIGWSKIREGGFSQYLLRPMNVITHIIMERVQFDGFGEVIIGLGIFAYAKNKLGLVFGIQGWIVFLIFVISGLAIYFSIKLMCAAVAFWTVSSGELMTVSYEISQFSKYPLDIYKNIILKNMLIYFMPFAVVSYFPMAYYIRDSFYISKILGIEYHQNTFLVIFIMAVTVFITGLSLLIWKQGIKRYNATGT